MGWLDEDMPGKERDTDEFIDFGIFAMVNQGAGLNRAILLDFNVDGIVWNKI